MGAWSQEPFGNDTACDWGYDLEEYSDLSYIEKTIEKALNEGQEYLEAPEGEEAIAAIEVVAKILGRGTQTDAYTEDIDAWVKKIQSKPSEKLIDDINKVIQLVLSDKSELAELWEGQDEWKQSVKLLQSAINVD